LHQLDCEAAGFEWIDCADREHSVIAFLRRARNRDDCVLVVCNFTPVVRKAYRIGVPAGGRYLELLNTDAGLYGGSDVGNLGAVNTEPIPAHGRPCSVNLTLPPLATLMFARARETPDS
jgi:1,4-alpha-glucan branching enzyme